MVSLTVDVSGLTDTQQADAADPKTPINQLKTYLEDALNGDQVFDAFKFNTAETVTISAGSIGPAKSVVVVDTQGAAATDDLDSIGSIANGRILWLRIASAARTVRIRHLGAGFGNIRTPYGADILLTSINQHACLLYNNTGGTWDLLFVAGTANLGAETELTIASGAVAKTRIRHRIDTESDAAQDDLATITGGNEGDVLELVAENSARLVTLVTSGNIRLSGTVARNLDTTNPVTLRHDGTNWCEQQMAVNARTPLDGNQVSLAQIRVPDRALGPDNGLAAINARRLVVLPSYEASRVIQVQAADTTVVALGCALPTITNTSPANANDSDGAFTRLRTSTSAGNLAGFISTTFNLARRQWNPVVTWIIKTPADITNIRYWLLLTSAAITDVDTIAGATEVAGFRFSTVTSDGGFKPVVKDATTQNVGSAIGTLSANELWMLRMRIDSAGGIAYFSARNTYSATWTTETTLSANLPAAATELGFCVRVINQVAANRDLHFGRMEITCQ
jgi:hypothetical protein